MGSKKYLICGHCDRLFYDSATLHHHLETEHGCYKPQNYRSLSAVAAMVIRGYDKENALATEKAMREFISGGTHVEGDRDYN